eukprot:TRINITY_DN42331_c0_g1_i1.p1 TRINITY_DN42331_c0_g1~~TRINITY_DN42331_c0_g1_i1.p1  ORF type:complete len:259 (+),score=26.27 TRINITY_DN42331_c0_g1_i1:245-1021(+)
MKVVIVPVLADNYSYLLVDEQSGTAAAVDPADPKLVMNAARHKGVRIVAVLTTHHHRDHSGGNEELHRLLPDVPVYGGCMDSVPACTHELQHGDCFLLGDDALTVKALHTPGHTNGHICYFVTANNGQHDPIIFTGDCLFVGGCGRFFEGSPADMYHSLCRVLKMLPPATKIYCGHEYTVKNLKFALWMEPGNPAAQDKFHWAMERRKNKLPTVPSTLAQELKYNPFMRVELPSLQAATGKEAPEDVMAEIRARKDVF